MLVFWLSQERGWDRLSATEWHVLVSIKESLDRWSLQEECVLTHLFRVVTLKVVVCTCLFLIEVVGILLRFERSINLLVKKGLPVVVAKPNMLLHLCRPIEPKPVARLSLQTLIDEVCGFERPAIGQLVPLDLDLLGEDHVSDFFATAADVGSAAQHEFVANDSNSKVVNSVAVILPAHNFRRHVARGSRGI